MTEHELLTFYGLQYNPFLPKLPTEDLWCPPGFDSFLFRIKMLLRTGGFALIAGETGLGKSKILQMLADWLDEHEGLAVGIMQRPQSTTTDFYRELGELFDVNLTPANRYGSFKALRVRFHQHIKTTLIRPVLLIDEAQVACSCTLTELRLLPSADFDSTHLLTIVLCGDNYLPARFRSRELAPLGSRIRTRLLLKPYPPQVIQELLSHLLERAGAPHLMTKSLRQTLVEHAAGNLRILTTMAAELLAYGAEHQIANLDDDVFFAAFHQTTQKAAARG